MFANQGKLQQSVEKKRVSWSSDIHSFYVRQNVFFSVQPEYSYFFADFRLKIFLRYSQILVNDISVSLTSLELK